MAKKAPAKAPVHHHRRRINKPRLTAERGSSRGLPLLFNCSGFWNLGGEPGQGIGEEALLQDWVEFGDAVVEDFCFA